MKYLSLTSFSVLLFFWNPYQYMYLLNLDSSWSANKRLVYEEVKKAIERDKSMVKVSELSRHGLMEITRKRVGCLSMVNISYLSSHESDSSVQIGRFISYET